PRRPARPRTESPAIPEPDSVAKPTVVRAKPAPRNKAPAPSLIREVMADPVADPEPDPAKLRAPPKPRVVRTPPVASAVVPQPPGPLPPRAATTARHAPVAKPVLVPAPNVAGAAATVSTPVWIPALQNQ